MLAAAKPTTVRRGTIRKTLLLCTLVVGFNAHAFAADVEFRADGNAPVRLHGTHPLIIIHQMTRPLTIGSGTTALDALRNIDCKSATGCVVTANITIHYNSGYCPSASAYLDGVVMNPPGVQTCDNQAVLQQSEQITTGTHTIQTEITDVGSGTVLSLEAEYSLYDR